MEKIVKMSQKIQHSIVTQRALTNYMRRGSIKLTSDDMRRFYSRERHPSNGTHDSFESTGSTGSTESTTSATINDSTYQTNSCNSSPKTLSRESSVDSVRSC